MSKGFVLIVPASLRKAVPPREDLAVAPYVSAMGVLAALRRPATGYVLYHDEGLASDAEVIAAVREAKAQVIEVVPERWDGERHSELSAACRGVIAGFGVNGMRAALALLAGEQASATGTRT